MPTKHRKRLTQMHKRYVTMTEHEKCQARQRYACNSDSVIERSSQRLLTDKTSIQKNRLRSLPYMKERLEHDVEYREQNRVTAAQSKKRRLETDESYRTEHAARAKSFKRMKLETDEKYHTAHVQRATHYRKTKLGKDADYRRANAEKTKKKLLTDVNYRYVNRRRALDRYHKIKKQSQNKEYHRAVVHVARKDEASDLPTHIR